ncbi:CocE/NonD family hydrolase [Streptomyces justiciae]|uniref:CocE/NonD family hydrolase n=1 Tax=Streptomyces justiciae TaxID=2780140 RepID=UPI002ADD3CA7|nr:CocE/NonD family hydrolase [Streptomyces justiciae]
MIARGGNPDYVFHDIDIIGFLNGKNRFEDVTGMHRAHPLDHPYWEDKRPQLTQVSIPAYVVASWTHPIHSRSTIKAYETLGSPDKWLRLHNTQEWPDLYDPANVEDLRRFFDYYLKGVDNGWEQTPRVRYAMIDPGGEDDFRTAGQWPPVEVEATTLYLDAATGRLAKVCPVGEAAVSYGSTDEKVSAKFTYTIEEETEFIGPSNLRFWVESSEADDLDLFGVVYKTNAVGKARLHIVFPSMKELFEQLIEADADLPGGPLWPGPNGRLRASHRAIDPERSTDLEPFVTHAREELIEPGTPVEVNLGLWPAGMLLHKGETLVVEIAGHVAGPIPAPRASDADPDAVMPTRNTGTHTIRTGGSYDSKVFLPLRPSGITPDES